MITKQVNLGRQTSSGTPPSRVRTPFFSACGRLLVRSHDRGVNHQVLVFRIPYQGAEDLLPDPADGPAGKTLVNTFILAVAFRQVAPASARAQHPQHAVDKDAVINCRPPDAFFASGQKVLNPAPLGFS